MFKDGALVSQDEDNPYPNVRRRTRPVSVNAATAPCHSSVADHSISSDPDPIAYAHADAGAGLPPADKPASEYDVGYGKPPKHTRFKKGQSGNPKGRPKGAKSAATIVNALLETRVRAKINGVTKMVSALELSFQQQMKKAAEGDSKALQFLLSYHIATTAAARSLSGGSPGESDTPLTDTERAILAHHQRSILLAQGLDQAIVAAVLSSMGLDDGEEKQS